MSDLEFRRRAMSQWGISGDKWDGFGFGMMCWNGASVTPQFPVKVCLTPMVATPIGHSITFCYGWRQRDMVSSSLSLAWYDSAGNFITYNDQRPNPRTVTAGHEYARMSFDFDEIADSYIYDNTTGEYLWRGSDYI